MLRYAGNSGKVIEKSQMLQAKDKTLFEKIRDYLTDLVNRIKKAYKDVRPETPEGEIISGMLDKAEEIQQLFTDAIADASENFKGAEVGHHPKHKGRIYYTITFAAPVEINGVRGNMAVVVRVDKKRDIAERAGGANDSSSLSPTDNISKSSISDFSENIKASPIREGQEASLENSGNTLTDKTRIPQNGTDVNTSISENDVKYSDRHSELHDSFDNTESDIRYSERNYSYESLVNKPDMKITVVDDTVKYKPSKEIRKNIVDTAIKNAASFGHTNENGNAVVYVRDIDTDVVVSRKSIQHGLDRRLEVSAPVVLDIGRVLENSIRINELLPREESAKASYVLVGTARGVNNSLYIVRSVVNQYANEITSVDVLYAVNAKKESAGIRPEVTDNSALPTDSTISISNLLDFVNKHFADILPEDILKHYLRIERTTISVKSEPTTQDGMSESLLLMKPFFISTRIKKEPESGFKTVGYKSR